jgi:hypothetical protein
MTNASLRASRTAIGPRCCLGLHTSDRARTRGRRTVTIVNPTTGDTFEVQLVADDNGVLDLLQARPRIDFLPRGRAEDRVGPHAGRAGRH